MPSFAQTTNTSSGTKIIDIEKLEGTTNAYRVLFDFCPTNINQNTIGVLLMSTIDTVPVPVANTDDQLTCKTYGSKVLAYSTTKIKAVNFEQTDLNDLINAFEEKIAFTEAKLVAAQQELYEEQGSAVQDEKVISDLQNSIKNFEDVLKSHKSGLKTLISLTV